MKINKIGKCLEKKIIVSLTTLICILCLIYSIAATYKMNYAGSPHSVEVDFKRDVSSELMIPVSIEDVSKLKKESFWDEISYFSETDTMAISGNRYCPVKLVYSNDSLIDFLNIRLINGTFFSKDACDNARNVAVISDKLAEKLFSNFDVLGNELDMFAQKYRVVGVYQSNGSVISLIGSDGADRIFVPSGSSNNQESLRVNTILAKDDDFPSEKFRIRLIEDMVSKILDIDRPLFRILDFYPSYLIITQFGSAFVFLIGLCSIWLICILFVTFTKRRIKLFISLQKDMYFFETLKNNKLKLVSLLGILLAFLGSIAGLFLIIRFHLYIPSEYIPSDNIFDLGFYWNRIKESIYASNSLSAFVPTEFSIYYKNVLMLEIVLLIFAFVTFISTISYVKILKLMEYSFISFLKPVIFALALAGIASLACALILGMKFIFPWKEVSVAILYILLYTVRPLPCPQKA